MMRSWIQTSVLYNTPFIFTSYTHTHTKSWCEERSYGFCDDDARAADADESVYDDPLTLRTSMDTCASTTAVAETFSLAHTHTKKTLHLRCCWGLKRGGQRWRDVCVTVEGERKWMNDIYDTQKRLFPYPSIVLHIIYNKLVCVCVVYYYQWAIDLNQFFTLFAFNMYKMQFSTTPPLSIYQSNTRSSPCLINELLLTLWSTLYDALRKLFSFEKKKFFHWCCTVRT